MSLCLFEVCNKIADIFDTDTDAQMIIRNRTVRRFNGCAMFQQAFDVAGIKSRTALATRNAASRPLANWIDIIPPYPPRI